MISLIETILIFIFLGGIALGIQLNYYYLSISIISLLGAMYFYKQKKAKEARIIKESISNKWGKEHIEERDLLEANKLYNSYLYKENPSFYIDDITWRDLNMDAVFSKIDHTKTLPGMQFLYYILRNPIFEKNTLLERGNTINSLLGNKDLSQALLFPLTFLGKKTGKKMMYYFNNGTNVSTEYLPILILLSYLPFIAIAAFIFNKQIGFILLISIIALNAYVYQIIKDKVYQEMETFKYLSDLIKCSKNIINQDIGNINIGQEELAELIKSTKQVSKNISKINLNDASISDVEIILHAYNMVFLREPKIFYKTIKSLNKYQEEFSRMYNIIGKIDAYISIASYMDSLSYYTEPKFLDAKSKFYLKTNEIYHPLLEKPVAYSVDLINTGVLVTGSNASGKSTFLRTLGINSIFAQTMFMVLAKDYTTSYFKLFTSIGTVDSIIKGDSYYMAEAKSLKRVLDEIDPNQPILCILDEIFRGTNTAERISAATEVLNYMIDRNCLVIAATHDLELINLVNNRYNNFHFKETILENDISFDYILRTGPCSSRNGIAILKHLGYPEEIYNNASISSQRYLI